MLVGYLYPDLLNMSDKDFELFKKNEVLFKNVAKTHLGEGGYEPRLILELMSGTYDFALLEKTPEKIADGLAEIRGSFRDRDV
jgi:hypothetical protein